VDLSDPAAHFFSAPPVTYDEEAPGTIDPEPLPRRVPVDPERRRHLGRVVFGAVALSCAICVAAGVRVATVHAATTRHAPPSEVAVVSPLPPPQVAAESAPQTQAPAVPDSPPVGEAPAAPLAPTAEAPPPATAEAQADKAPAELDPAAARDAKRASQRALDRGDARASIAAGEQSVALDPTDAEAWLILGAAYQVRGTLSEARRCFSTCAQVAKRGPRSECSALAR